MQHRAGAQDIFVELQINKEVASPCFRGPLLDPWKTKVWEEETSYISPTSPNHETTKHCSRNSK